MPLIHKLRFIFEKGYLNIIGFIRNSSTDYVVKIDGKLCLIYNCINITNIFHLDGGSNCEWEKK